MLSPSEISLGIAATVAAIIACVVFAAVIALESARRVNLSLIVQAKQAYAFFSFVSMALFLTLFWTLYQAV